MNRSASLSLLLACCVGLAHAGPQGTLQEVAAQVEASSFDPDETVMRLDLEAANIVEFVSQEVGYVSYPGSLRGIHGTLQSLRGNSLDQALLLAHLLKQAGFDARIVHGALATQDRRRLVLGMRQLHPAREADAVAVGESATHARFMDALPQLDDMRDQLPGPSSVLARLVEEAADYYWVEFDEGAGWQPAHPAFGTHPVPKTEPAGYFADAVPTELVHTVSIQAFVQRREAGNIHVTPITKVWRRPAGNLLGRSLTFSLVPLGLNENTASDLDQHLARTDLFAPMLNGAPAGDWVIDNKGNLIDALAASGAAADLFETLRDKMESAIVGAAPELGGSFALERIWLEIVLTAPGQAPRKIFRNVYDEEFDGAVSRQEENATEVPNASLFVAYHLAFDIGALAPDYLVKRLIDALSVSNSWLDAMLARGVHGKTEAPFPGTEISRAFSLLSQQTVQNALLETDVLRYRAEPGILGLRESYRANNRFQVSTDIVSNRQRFLRFGNDDVMADPAAALRHGVWETATEWLPRQLRAGATIDSLNTIDYVAQHQQDGGKLELVREAGSGLPDAALQDLRDGYWLLVPQTAGESMPLAYWRTEPRSGETLGMLSDGRGSELTEYLVQLAGISLTFVNAVASLAECEEAGGNLAERACCIMNANANTAFDNAYSNVIADMFVESSALIGAALQSQPQQPTGEQSVNLMDCGDMQDYGDF